MFPGRRSRLAGKRHRTERGSDGRVIGRRRLQDGSQFTRGSAVWAQSADPAKALRHHRLSLGTSSGPRVALPGCGESLLGDFHLTGTYGDHSMSNKIRKGFTLIELLIV